MGAGPSLQNGNCCAFMPPDADTAQSPAPSRRSSYSYEDLLACGRGELFGPGNAQLPLPPMLMFDRISSIGEDGGAHGMSWPSSTSGPISGSSPAISRAIR